MQPPIFNVLNEYFSFPMNGSSLSLIHTCRFWISDPQFLVCLNPTRQRVYIIVVRKLGVYIELGTYIYIYVFVHSHEVVLFNIPFHICMCGSADGGRTSSASSHFVLVAVSLFQEETGTWLMANWVKYSIDTLWGSFGYVYYPAFFS